MEVLDRATAQEDENAGRPDSLLSDIKRMQPRLRTRVRGVRVQYRQVRERIAAVRHELGGEVEDDTDFGDVRQRLASLLMAIRHHQARESDLIYEAYFEAFNADLRAGGLSLPGAEGEARYRAGVIERVHGERH